MQSRTIEIWVGFFMLLGILAILVLAMKVSNLTALATDSSYEVIAKFENVGGLKPKSPVKISGVRIGRVSNIHFDDELYEAVVTLKIDSQYSKIPVDTSASIFTAGLLGEQYISLKTSGWGEDFLQQGSEITKTQSAIILEQLVGKFLFDKAAGDNDSMPSE